MCPHCNFTVFPFFSFPHPDPEALVSWPQLLSLVALGVGVRAGGLCPLTSGSFWSEAGLPAPGPCQSAEEPSPGHGEDEEGARAGLTTHCYLPVPSVLPQEILSELTLDALLDMNEVKVKETLRRYGANTEECGRLQYALACLRKVTGLGR